MSKKLLEENTIRKFMKLAGVQKLSESFIDENYAPQDEVVEETAAPDALEEVENLEEMGGYDHAYEAEDEVEDVEVDMDLEEPAPEEEAPAEEPMMEVEQDLEAANVQLDMTSGLVNEVTRRVARRLLRDSAKGN